MSWTGAALGHCTSQETSLIIQPFNSQRDKAVRCTWPVTPEKDHYRLPEFSCVAMKPATERFGAFNNKNIGRTDANLVGNAERSVHVFRSNQRCIRGGRGGQIMLILYAKSWSMGTELTCKTWFKFDKLIIKLYIIWLNIQIFNLIISILNRLHNY